MKANILAGLLAVSVIAGEVNCAVAQRPDARSGQSTRGNTRGGSSSSGSSSGNINYNDPSRRNTQNTERDDKKAKAAEEAKKKAEEDKRRAEREKRYGQNGQNGQDGKATGMTSAKPGDAKNGAKTPGKPGSERASKPTNAGGTDPTSREVNAVMLEAVQTQKVNFDPAEAQKDPDILLLNAPKFDKAERARAGDTGFASPL